jgi:hypothetical protein
MDASKILIMHRQRSAKSHMGIRALKMKMRVAMAIGKLNELCTKLSCIRVEFPRNWLFL